MKNFKKNVRKIIINVKTYVKVKTSSKLDFALGFGTFPLPFIETSFWSILLTYCIMFIVMHTILMYPEKDKIKLEKYHATLNVAYPTTTNMGIWEQCQNAHSEKVNLFLEINCIQCAFFTYIFYEFLK